MWRERKSRVGHRCCSSVWTESDYTLHHRCTVYGTTSFIPASHSTAVSIFIDKKRWKNYLIISFLGSLVLWTADVITRRRRKRSENAAFFNCLNFKIHRHFPNLLTLSNVVELSWSWIPDYSSSERERKIRCRLLTSSINYNRRFISKSCSNGKEMYN